MIGFMWLNGALCKELKVVNRLISAHMALELLCSAGMKNLPPVDIIFLCLTAGISFIAMVCVVLMGS